MGDGCSVVEVVDCRTASMYPVMTEAYMMVLRCPVVKKAENRLA